jgi:hypothetical protein
MDEKRTLRLQRSAYDQGLIDGRIAKASNVTPSAYAIVGSDEYAQGYRAAYFSRATASSVRQSQSL